MAPPRHPGWVRNTVKRSTWRTWGPGPRMGNPGEGLDGTPRDSNRRIGLSEKHWSPQTCRGAIIMRTLRSHYPSLLVFTLHWNKKENYLKMFFCQFGCSLSMPHVRGCLKTSSQDNCVWSDPFCTVNSEKPPKLQYESATLHISTLLCFLRVGAWEETNIWTTTTTLAWYPQKLS